MVNLLGRDRQQSQPFTLDERTSGLLEERLEVALRFVERADRSRPIAQRYRTPALEPDLEDEPSLAGIEAALHALAERRAVFLEQRERDAAPAADGGQGAAETKIRMVAVEIEASIGDGRAEAASRGFFDIDDRPPWDLWLVALGATHPSQPDEPRIYLIALVPEECVGVAGGWGVPFEVAR